MALDLLTYKPDQGRYARQGAFWTLAALSYYGATTCHSFFDWAWSRQSLGFTVPVLEIDVTPAVLIAVALFFALVIGIRKGLNHPKFADLIIDTEAEMKRVTWPSWPETLNGSLVVIVTVVALLVVLAGADLILSRFFEHVVF